MGIRVGEDMLVFAFRYALGRMSYAPHTVVECLHEHLESLELHTLKQIDKEIMEYYDSEINSFRPENDDPEQYHKGLWLWLKNEIRKELAERGFG